MAGNMRSRLVEAATDLILSQGFAATSVDEICKRAGASKGSFYHFFESKADLGPAVLSAWFERVQAALDGGPYQTETDPGRKLIGFVNHARNVSPSLWGKGSVLSAVAMELGAADSTISAASAPLFRAQVREHAPLFEPAAEALSRSGSGVELAQLFMAVVEGAGLLARAEGKPDLAFEIFGTFQLCLQRLMEYTREST